MRRLFTSESVTEGHPDKMCDQISDAILDSILRDDPMARVACETCTTTGMVMVMGEISTTTYVSIPDVVRDVVLEIGYNSSEMGFDGKSCSVLTSVHEQSEDIDGGVSRALESRNEASLKAETGAGDQGMMFGYATNETDALMPLPIFLAHRLTRRMSKVRKNGSCAFMRPDGKAQVTISYDDMKNPYVETLVISTQHSPDISQKQIEEAIFENVIKREIPKELLRKESKFLINPSGRFVIGGPAGDSGLTGRKIIVDTYGGMAPHGGGAFSGKDPTKVDRSAAYAARHIAKNIVAAGLADRCQVALAYAIGVAQPVSFDVETFGTGRIDEELLSSFIRANVDFSPDGIISRLDLRRPIYQQTASYGHFGRIDLDLPWERNDLVELLRTI